MLLLEALMCSEKPRQGHVASSWHVQLRVKPQSCSALELVEHHPHQHCSIVVSF